MVGDFVANGEIGRVVDVWDGRYDQVYRGQVQSQKRVKRGNCVLVEMQSPKRFVIASGEALFDLVHAYAITTHKSQGSSSPIIFFMADNSGSANRIASRELVYTALSRFEDIVFTIGSQSEISNMCKRVALSERLTLFHIFYQHQLQTVKGIEDDTGRIPQTVTPEGVE